MSTCRISEPLPPSRIVVAANAPLTTIAAATPVAGDEPTPASEAALGRGVSRPEFALRAAVLGGGQAASKRPRKANIQSCGVVLPIEAVEGDMNGRRFGAPELVRRGMSEQDMPRVAALSAATLRSARADFELGVAGPMTGPNPPMASNISTARAPPPTRSTPPAACSARSRLGDLRLWTAAAGRRPLDSRDAMAFSLHSAALQAALDGAGAPMGREALVAEALARAALVAPFRRKAAPGRRSAAPTPERRGVNGAARTRHRPARAAWIR